MEETSTLPETMFTIRETAKLLRMHYKSVYRWSDEGKIRTVRIGHKVLVKASEIERLVREGQEKE